MARPSTISRTRRALGGAPGRAVASCSSALAITVLPVFLVGALSTSIGDELGFGPAGTGVALAAFFLASGVTAIPVGWVTDRIGPPRAMRAGAVVSGASMAAIGLAAQSVWHIAALLAVAGVAIGFVDTGASAWFAGAVPEHRRGLAFGIKESSVPTASLLAGLSLPLLAARADWRSVFLLGAALAPVVWAVVPTSVIEPRPSDAPASGTRRWGPLTVFAVGLALGTGAATAASTFLVPALEDRGWTASAAGILLAVASIASVVFRLVAGGLSDRRPGWVWSLIVLTMAAGAAGSAVLWLVGNEVVVVAGAVAVLGLGWGWTGLAFHAVLTATADRPALGAGLVLGGLSLGGAGGPALFGVISAGASYEAAWAMTAGALVAGAVAVEVARRTIEVS